MLSPYPLVHRHHLPLPQMCTLHQRTQTLHHSLASLAHQHQSPAPPKRLLWTGRLSWPDRDGKVSSEPSLGITTGVGSVI